MRLTQMTLTHAGSARKIVEIGPVVFAPRAQDGFVLYLSGRCTYTYEYTAFTAEAGSFLYLPQGQAYRIDRIAPGSSCLLINFDALTHAPRQAFGRRVQNATALAELFERAIRIRASSPANRQPLLLSLLYAIIAHVEAPETYIFGGARRRVCQAAEQMEAACTDPAFSCAQLAADCGLSDKYFQQLFREIYQTTPGERLRLLRLRRARQLLESTPLPISAVAEQSGFANAYYFSRFFKERMGLTPTQYRRAARET